MVPKSATDERGARQSFVLDAGNTFGFVPGPMLGVSCPACFKSQLLKTVVTGGVCTQCGTELELTLSARVDGSVESG